MRGQVDLVRVVAIGSVDDGKSTLLGRLLVDLGRVPDDELLAVKRVSDQRGHGVVDLSLLTDGLRAEREQGITIDVAYRYFRTERRVFVLADCPGHVRYTRNMVTGASLADVAVLLIDASRGVTDQTRRHAFVVSMLGVGHVIVCVSKMDLVGWDPDAFARIREHFSGALARLAFGEVTFIPVSGLHGDNVVERSRSTPWYEGPTLMYLLENVHIASDRDLVDVRFPVQWVTRPAAGSPGRRWYAGGVAGGVLRAGDEVVALPSGDRSTIASIATYDGPVEEAFPPLSVRLELADDVDLARGDMLVRPGNRPSVTTSVEALLCWMGSTPLRAGARYAVRHTTRTTRATIDAVRYRVDMATLHRDTAVDHLDLNDVGRVHLATTEPLFTDPYRRNRMTGSLILIDEGDDRTVAAAAILDRTE